MTRQAPRPAVLAALALIMGAAVLFLFLNGHGLTFYVDQWNFMVIRRGHSPRVFLDEQNGHLMLVPIVVHKVMLKVFGATSYVPFRVLALGVQLTYAGFFFVLVRRRANDVVALAFTASVLFFGPGWEPIASPVGMLNTISLAAGLGMLVALDAQTRRGDVLAFVAVLVSVLSFSYGVMFAAAAAVDVLLRPGGRRRLWIPAIPVALYVLWDLAYGGNTQASVDNVAGLASSLADSASAVSASVSGLYRPAGPGHDHVTVISTYGVPLALALVAVVACRLRGPGRDEPRLWALVVLTLSLWTSVALVQDDGIGRVPDASRYLLPGGVFVLLIIAELLRDVRFGRRAYAVLGVWMAAVLAAGVANLHTGYVALRNLADYDRAVLGALELARDVVPPGYAPEGSRFPEVREHYLYDIKAAGSYFSAIDDYGSPAFSASELQRAPGGPRQAADLLLAEATGLRASPAGGRVPGSTPPALEPGGSVSSRTAGGCLVLTPQGQGPAAAILAVPPGGLLVSGDQPAPLDLHLRRFADNFPAPLGPVPGNSPVVVTPHPDRAAGVRWHARIDGISAAVRVCGI